MFDVNEPHTLYSLTKWWKEFKDRAPLADEDADDFCCVVVGNKIDLVEEGYERRVTEADAWRFLEELMPTSSTSPRQPPSPVQVSCNDDECDEGEATDDELSMSQHTERPQTVPLLPGVTSPNHTISKIAPQPHIPRNIGNGTIGTTHSALSIYHTPSSSIFDQFHSARASPEPSYSHSPPHLLSSSPHKSPRARIPSLSSSSSGMTITPSLFARTKGVSANGIVGHRQTSGSSTATIPAPTPTAAPRDHGPRLFFTSARTGQGVQGVFEYIAKRVAMRWEEEERVMQVMEGSAAESVRLVEDARAMGRKHRRNLACCT
jgi:Ras-related protein Rab-7A